MAFLDVQYCSEWTRKYFWCKKKPVIGNLDVLDDAKAIKAGVGQKHVVDKKLLKHVPRVELY